MKRWGIRALRRAAGAVLLASLTATLGLLIAQGRWREAIPLHLCSLSALAALRLSGRPGAGTTDFLWYLGMPGALLALLFPAPAVSRCQGLMNASYAATHALILIVPTLAFAMGERPRPGRAAQMMLLLQVIGLAASGVNAALGTNFLFLAGPPAGTPLVIPYAWGYGAYLLFLEGMMLTLCLLTDALGRRLFGKRTRGK